MFIQVGSWLMNVYKKPTTHLVNGPFVILIYVGSSVWQVFATITKRMLKLIEQKGKCYFKQVGMSVSFRLPLNFRFTLFIQFLITYGRNGCRVLYRGIKIEKRYTVSFNEVPQTLHISEVWIIRRNFYILSYKIIKIWKKLLTPNTPLIQLQCARSKLNMDETFA